MCAPSQGAMLPYGLKVPSPYFPFGPTGSLTQAHLSALDFQRSQLNDYNVRVQFGLRNYQNTIGLSPFHAYISDPYTQAYFYKHDQRTRFVQEEPKPSHSYIGLIGMAILNSKEKKLVLSDIYQWILDNYPYFRTRGPGWRNSIRHNLSLNDCFIKAGRSANGKGHYWAVHPANVEDFERGDFRRRRAQRKVRRHMGLSVPDDDDSPTPSPTQSWPHHDLVQDSDRGALDTIASPDEPALRSSFTRSDPEHVVFCHPTPAYGHLQSQPKKQSRKRLFDMASLLAPDDDKDELNSDEHQAHNGRLSHEKINSSGFNFHAMQHEIKPQEKNFNTPDENSPKNESYTYEDVNVDVNSSFSGSGREMNDDSEDDGENDDIQVTSGEDSPKHVQNVECDAGQEQSGNIIQQNSHRNTHNNEGNSNIDKSEHEPSKWPSYISESKTENALDLSSSTHTEDETKVDMFYIKIQEYKMLNQNPTGKDCDFQQLHSAEKSGHGMDKVVTDLEKCNGFDNFKSLTNSNSMHKNTRKGCERERQKDADDIMSKLSSQECCRNPGELSLENSADLELIKRAANKYHCYRPELHEARRLHIQDHGDTNSGAIDTSIAKLDHRMHGKKMECVSEVPVSETVRVLNDHISWADMPKNMPTKDRLSAFSALGIRNHSLYSPLQLRNFPISTHRLLPKTIPMRAGISSQLISLSAPPSSATISLTNGLDTGISKCSYRIPSNICSSSAADGVSK